MSVSSVERKKKIIDEINRTGKVKVVDLAGFFQVSTETIRRDLDGLEESGLLKRVYGGAIKTTYKIEPPFSQRAGVHLQEKIRIGHKAAALVSDGDAIVIDVGTTTLEFARALKQKKELTIFTNSIPVASVIMEALNNHELTGELILLGGSVNPTQRSTSGPLTISVLHQFHIDKAFISVGGISLKNGVSDYDLDESYVSKEMIEASNDTIVLADHSKIGNQAFSKICSIDKIDVIVSDQVMPESWCHDPAVKALKWIVADENC